MGLCGFGYGYERAQLEYDRALPAEGGEPCYGCCAGCGEDIRERKKNWPGIGLLNLKRIKEENT